MGSRMLTGGEDLVVNRRWRRTLLWNGREDAIEDEDSGKECSMRDNIHRRPQYQLSFFIDDAARFASMPARKWSIPFPTTSKGRSDVFSLK